MSQLIYNDLKQMMKEVTASNMPTEITIGTIVSLSPVQINIDGNTEYYPSSAFVIPEHLTDREVEVSIDDLGFSGTMKLNNALKEGDGVLLIQCQRGQKLVVLDRVSK